MAKCPYCGTEDGSDEMGLLISILARLRETRVNLAEHVLRLESVLARITPSKGE